MQYQDDEEGLAILSKIPMDYILERNDIINQCAQRVRINNDGLNIGITNVHLTWKIVTLRERK